MVKLVPLLAAAFFTLWTSTAGAQPNEARAGLAEVKWGRDALKRLDVAGRDVSPKKVVASLGKRRRDPSAAFFWVRDNISYEPYQGAQRGVRGTIVGRAGNSIDQALLLQKLLDLQRVKSRLVAGELPRDLVVALLSAFAGKGRLVGRGVPANLDAYDVKDDRAAINRAENHYWVEANIKGKWVAMDPANPSAVLGEAPTAGKPLGDVPRREVVSMTMTIDAHRTDGTKRELFRRAGTLEDFTFRNIKLTFPRKGGSITPRVQVPGEVKTGSSEPWSKIDRLTLSFVWQRGGRATQTTERDLFVRGATTDLFDSDQQLFSVMVLPAWLDDDFLKVVARRELDTLYKGAQKSARIVEKSRDETLTPQLTDWVEDVLGRIAGLLGLTFATVSDRTTLRFGQKLGVVTFYAQPRIFVVAGIRRADRLLWHIDLRQDEIIATPAQGLPRAFSWALTAARGRFNAEFEAATLATMTGQPAVSTPGIFAASKKPPVVVHGGNIDKALPRLGLARDARGRLGELVRRRGRAALVVPRPVPMGAARLSAWWALDPTTGAIVGTREDGSHGGQTESAITGKAPQPERIGRLTDRVLTEVLSQLAKLARTLYALLRDVPNVCSIVCSTMDDLEALSRLSCDKPRRDSDATACVTRRRATASTDVIGLNMSCEAAIEPSRCGAATAVATMTGKWSAVWDIRPRGSVSGPWTPETVPPLSESSCACGANK